MSTSSVSPKLRLICRATMKSPGGRLPRPRLLLIVLASVTAIASLIGLKLCRDKYQLYREFADLERLGREVTSLEHNIDDLAANAVQLETRLETMDRSKHTTAPKVNVENLRQGYRGRIS